MILCCQLTHKYLRHFPQKYYSTISLQLYFFFNFWKRSSACDLRHWGSHFISKLDINLESFCFLVASSYEIYARQHRRKLKGVFCLAVHCQTTATRKSQLCVIIMLCTTHFFSIFQIPWSLREDTLWIVSLGKAQGKRLEVLEKRILERKGEASYDPWLLVTMEPLS